MVKIPFKKIVSFALAIGLIFLVACGPQKGDQGTGQETKTVKGDQDQAEAPGETGSGSSKEKSLVIGSKKMPEGVILGEMFSLLLTDRTDIKPVTKFELGATPILHEAIVKGEIDLYPEYTSTGWLSILKQSPISDPDQLYSQLKNSYEKEFGLSWSPLIGFNNTYTLIVNQETAEKYQLKSMSDLASASPELVFGANGDFFEREDGFPFLEEKYGMKFKSTSDIDIGLKYQACLENQIQATTAFTTDGYLSENKVRVLEDDKHIFPNYFSAFVYRQEILEKYPELADIFAVFEGLINDQEMQTLNYQAQAGDKSYREIAEDFLRFKNLLK